MDIAGDSAGDWPMKDGTPPNEQEQDMEPPTIRYTALEHVGAPDATTEISWLGHSTVVIRTGETWILTDPVLRGRMAHLRRRSPLRREDWPDRVDAILLSHLHLDHCDLPTLRRLGRDIPIVAPVGAGAWLRRRGFRRVEELADGETISVERVEVTAVPATHSGRRIPFGPTTATVGHVVRGGHTTYFAGDTDLFDGMASIDPGIDAALIPVWGWGRTLGTGHLDPERAAQALALLRPRLAIPIHWGTFHPLGTGIRDRRFLEDPPHRFAALASQLAPEVDVRVIEPGWRLVMS